jgi:hypothetical protein
MVFESVCKMNSSASISQSITKKHLKVQTQLTALSKLVNCLDSEEVISIQILKTTIYRPIHPSVHPSIHPSMYGSTALCWALAVFQFLYSYTQTVGLLGRGISPSQGRYLHAGQHKHRINVT